MLRNFGLIVLYSSMLLAKVDLEVINEHQGNSYSLDSNDIVFSGDTVKFQFYSDSGENLEIFYTNKDGIEQKLFSNNLEKEKIYTYPEGNQRLKLDNNPGTELFSFKTTQGTTQFILNHLENNADAHKAVETASSTLAYQLLDSREYIDYANTKTITRGEQEKIIWKTLQNATVIIESSNDAKDSIGAGTIIEIKNEKYILTNWHVVEINDNNVYVAFKPKIGNKPSKTNYYKVEVVKKDILKDLALLKFDNVLIKDKNVISLKFAEESSLEVGEDIFNMGHPVGYFYTPGSGMIKNISNNYSWSDHEASFVIQHSIPSSNGNSGGPLVNKKLELVGINAFSNTQGQNLNFAISIIDIKAFLEAETKEEHKKILTDLDSLNRYILESGYKKEKTLGYIKIAKLDLNKNGIVDALLFDTDNDGMWNLIKYDKDEDGTIEKVTNY